MNPTDHPLRKQFERLLNVSSDTIARQEHELQELRAAVRPRLSSTTIAIALSIGVLLGIGFCAIVWGLW